MYDVVIFVMCVVFCVKLIRIWLNKVFDTLKMIPTMLETIRWTVCIHVCVFLLSP